MLASLCSKSFRLGFHSRWSKNFQMYKLSFKKVKEQEAKLSPFSGSWRKQEILRKMSISASLTMPRPLTLWVTANCGKFFKRWEYQTTWPAFWEIYMQVKRQQLELDMEQQTGSKLGKEYIKAVFNLYAEYIMWNVRLYEVQAGIKITGRNINNLRYADDTTLMAERE